MPSEPSSQSSPRCSSRSLMLLERRNETALQNKATAATTEVMVRRPCEKSFVSGRVRTGAASTLAQIKHLGLIWGRRSPRACRLAKMASPFSSGSCLWRRWDGPRGPPVNHLAHPSPSSAASDFILMSCCSSCEWMDSFHSQHKKLSIVTLIKRWRWWCERERETSPTDRGQILLFWVCCAAVNLAKHMSGTHTRAQIITNWFDKKVVTHCKSSVSRRDADR